MLMQTGDEFKSVNCRPKSDTKSLNVAATLTKNKVLICGHSRFSHSAAVYWKQQNQQQQNN